MKIYIAFLRGINISGKNKVPMAELKKAFEDVYKRQPLGPSRKYYSLTEEGEEYVAAFYGNWKEICESVKKIFEEGLI